MFVDSETFVDLEFFQCRQLVARPVFHYIDYCRTDGGRDHLISLLKSSPATAQEIIELQTITRFMFEHHDQVDLDVPKRLFRELDEYLNSNYICRDFSASISPFFHAFFYRYRHLVLFSFISRGVKLVLTATSTVANIILALNQKKNLPEPVKNLFDEFFRIFYEIGFDKIAQKFANPFSCDVFAVDYQLRVQSRENLQKLLAIIAKFDAHLGMGIATRKNNFAFPAITGDATQKIDIQGMYHPFLENPVTNGFQLEEGKNILFLTGPNMAGKTTYLKALGIAMILAHSGMGVPAQAMTFSPVDWLFFQLTVQDDLRLGISSFFQEIIQVQRIIQLLEKGFRLFVVVDEMFKGTNVSDALECSKIVINGFARHKKHFFVVSSHLYELEPAISANANVRFGLFESFLQNNILSFPHKLSEGVSNIRIGTRLLEDAGISKYFSDHPAEAD